MLTVERDPALFPLLSEEQIELLRPFAQEEATFNGDLLIQEGAREFDFFVVLEGSVGIYDIAGDGDLIVEHAESEFVGDTDMLSTRAAVIRAQVVRPGRVLRVPFASLKEIVACYSELSDIILGAFLLRRTRLLGMSGHGVKIIGSRYSSDTFRIREFFERNHVPYNWLDLERDAAAAELLAQFAIRPDETPILIYQNRQIYRNPSTEQIAQCTGVAVQHEQALYDLLVVGAGPAGLAASVYGASEGLKVMTLDSVGPGGQAGTSSKIENYLGFPTGISGGELASRAYTQAQKFGCTISIPQRAEQLNCQGTHLEVTLAGGTVLQARSLVIATGARYRKLDVPGMEAYEGNGIYYGATLMEAQTCGGQDAVLVGGGNSAGQGAVFLAKHARHVHLLIRGKDLSHSMSRYLIDRIEADPNITLHAETEVHALAGDGHLERITCRNRATGDLRDVETQNLFVFIGADPCTDWLSGCVALDGKGFVLTGNDLTTADLARAEWSLDRRPSMLETSLPGVFAVGDVRSGSTKRVASGVGEGSMAVSYVHQFLG